MPLASRSISNSSITSPVQLISSASSLPGNPSAAPSVRVLSDQYHAIPRPQSPIAKKPILQSSSIYSSDLRFLNQKDFLTSPNQPSSLTLKEATANFAIASSEFSDKSYSNLSHGFFGNSDNLDVKLKGSNHLHEKNDQSNNRNEESSEEYTEEDDEETKTGVSDVSTKHLKRHVFTPDLNIFLFIYPIYLSYPIFISWF
ncbi:unnamed protein product [Protopolystoma xenopodis]|uniref:Uncharacterized protein n=1 Tax=Protopolystoma xenopodis TaxID=117903 RepID=A0A3S5BUA4_9PLAT|nr:unnamed protein product [Protopolystoma xenopodis]